jgi:hypothetical protein
MPTWTDDDYEMDDDGRMRNRKIAGDGDRIAFSMTAMDAARGFHRNFADGSVDHTHWSRPGFRFSDTNDEASLRAEQAYQARNRRMADAWKRKGTPQWNDENGGRTAVGFRPHLSLDQARALADAAYAERCERMRNAWRNRQP